MMRAVVVGLGRIGSTFQRDPLRPGVVTHAAAWSNHPEVTLAAGVDPDRAARGRFEADHRVPAYASWEELKQEHTPDFVSVCVPPAGHLGAVVSALEAGAKRVICEKPCTPDLVTIEELLRLVGVEAARVGVNYTRQYDALQRAVLEDIGTIRAGNGYYTAGLVNTASHWLATLLGTGQSVVEVTARRGAPGSDPSPFVTLELASGGTVSLHGLDVGRYLVYEMDLLTDRGRVRLERSGTVGGRFEPVPSTQFSGYQELYEVAEDLPPGLVNPLQPVIDDAVRSWREERPMRCSLSDAVEVHRVLAAIQTALSSRRGVTLT